LLDSVGFTAPSTHLSLRELGAELPRTLDLAEVIGHRYLVVPSPDLEIAAGWTTSVG
jgi:hypothetical protein